MLVQKWLERLNISIVSYLSDEDRLAKHLQTSIVLELFERPYRWVSAGLIYVTTV